MSLLIRATVEVSGDPALLAPMRERINSSLAADYAGMPYTEMHREGALHYDIKTASGIPFPVLIAASEEFPDLMLSLRWVNPELGTQGTAAIKAGRIEAQSADPLDRASAGRQPGYVAAREGGTLLLAVAIFSVKNDGCTGYAISAGEDALFQIHLRDDGARLQLSKGEENVWDAGCDVSLATGRSRALEDWTPLPIDAGDYGKWRNYAEAFVAEWFWFEAAEPEETIVERQRCVDHDIPVNPANLRYAKLKAMRDNGAAASGLYEFDQLSEGLRYVRRVLMACFVATEGNVAAP